MEKNIIFAHQNGARWLATTAEFIKYIKNRIFTRYVSYSTTSSKASKHFYFILTKQYGSFLTFWAPSQLSATKSRFWDSSQTMLRNADLIGFHAFLCISSKMWFLSIVCEEPQKRDLVAESWKGAQNVKKDPYFLVRIK